MNALTVNYWLKQHWKVLLLSLAGLLLLGQIIYQVVYPSSRLIPGIVVDGLSIGGMRVDEAAKAMDDAYGELPLKIYFGKNEAAFQEPKLKEVGIGVDNLARLETINYPFVLRLIPASIFWAPALAQTGNIEYTYDKNKISSYTQSKVGEDCSIPPKNASLKLVESRLQLVPSATGGNCDITELQQALAEVKPDPDKEISVRIAIDETPAPISDDMARDLAAKLNSRMAVPMPITVDTSTDTIPGRVVLSWLDFIADVPEESIDNSGNQVAQLKYAVNSERMEDYLNQGIASKLIKKPGVTKVTTLDFNETARVTGANGRALDMAKAVASVQNYIDQKAANAVAATQVVGPTVVYTRNYTPTQTGFSALIQQFAMDNPGTFGIKFEEISGVRDKRSASYRADARMPAGGIHSLYIGYTEIMEEKAGTIRPVDKISGDTNATTCLKEMIEETDEGCRRGFYDYFGYETLTRRAAELGLKNTVFAGEDTVTSANDLHTLIVGLYKNQIARLEGASKIMSALRANRTDDGIPSGLTRSQVANVIGGTETIHNDSAIVTTSDYGVFALTILSDGSSWDKVSELSKKILDLKMVKVKSNN